jgi:hypothetical protein
MSSTVPEPRQPRLEVKVKPAIKKNAFGRSRQSRCSQRSSGKWSEVLVISCMLLPPKQRICIKWQWWLALKSGYFLLDLGSFSFGNRMNCVIRNREGRTNCKFLQAVKDGIPVCLALVVAVLI